MKLGLTITDYYFDSNDYSNPVKINISTNNKFYLASSLTKFINAKVRRNDVIDITSALPFASSNRYSFFSVGEIFQDYYSEKADGVILDLKFIFDDKYQTINRTVFSVGDMFGKIGGMDSMLWMIASFFVGLFSSKLYKFSLVSSFYNVISDKQNQNVNLLISNINDCKSNVKSLAERPRFVKTWEGIWRRNQLFFQNMKF